jgi:hypothetical protein
MNAFIAQASCAAYCAGSKRPQAPLWTESASVEGKPAQIPSHDPRDAQSAMHVRGSVCKQTAGSAHMYVYTADPAKQPTGSHSEEHINQLALACLSWERSRRVSDSFQAYNMRYLHADNMLPC